jgi:hypothetical protein
LKVVPVQRSIFSQRLWVFALEDGVLGVCFTRFCSIQFGTIPEIELAVQDCMHMSLPFFLTCADEGEAVKEFWLVLKLQKRQPGGSGLVDFYNVCSSGIRMMVDLGC